MLGTQRDRKDLRPIKATFSSLPQDSVARSLALGEPDFVDPTTYPARAEALARAVFAEIRARSAREGTT